MQELDFAVRITEIILFIVLSILTIFIIISIKKITVSVDKIEKDVDDLQKKMEPLIESSLIISSDIKEISTGVKSQMSKVHGIIDSVKDIVGSVKDTTDSIIEFEQKTQKEVEVHVSDVLNLVSAIVTGVRTFVSVITGPNGIQKSGKKSRSSDKNNSRIMNYSSVDDDTSENQF